MFNEPRNWKWMVPAAGVFVLPLGGWWLRSMLGDVGGLTVQCLEYVTWPLALICLVQAVSMHHAYYRSLAVNDLERQQAALSITADSVKLQAANGVHPQTLELVLRDQARRWGIVSATKSKSRRPYSVMFARPRVTQGFFVHFLKMSNEQTYMPLSILSDGDKSWDPDGRVTAREMYADVESLLIEEGKATRPMGPYKPGYWVAGWTPASVAKDYDLNLDEWDYEEEEQKAESRTQTKADDPLEAALKDLDQTSWMKQMTEGAK